jgi:hypothetical protein
VCLQQQQQQVCVGGLQQQLTFNKALKNQQLPCLPVSSLQVCSGGKLLWFIPIQHQLWHMSFFQNCNNMGS